MRTHDSTRGSPQTAESPHIDIGVDPATGQIQFGFADIAPRTPIVIDNFVTALPGGTGGFTSIPFDPARDVALRTASQATASELGFTSFAEFTGSTPQLRLEAVALDANFQAFVFGAPLLDAPGDGFTLNRPGQFIDFHPTYLVPAEDDRFIGRAEGTFRLVPVGSSAVSASNDFDLIFVVGGDHDDDARLTAADIDLLSDAVRLGAFDEMFDLSRDGELSQEDRRLWVEVLRETRFGDANLDSRVNLADFAALGANFGQAARGWATGDFSGDRSVNLADFASIGVNFGFIADADAAVAAPRSRALPEPASALVGVAGLALLTRRRAG